MPRTSGPRVNPAALRSLRAAKDMTQDHLAGAANIDAAYVSRLERGLQQRPSYEITWRIANALGVPVEDITIPEGVRS